MHIAKLKDSRFLKKEDVGRGALLTIVEGREENIAMEGQPADMRFCLYFRETEKPLILNSTNAQIIAAFLGSEETNDWNGRQIVLYADPNVSFGGKLVGGIRARAPRVVTPPTSRPATPAPAAPAPAPPPPAPPPPAAAAGLPPADDDIPF